MNDPNGLLVVDGQLHLTYQHEPDAPRWGRMHWGHAVSADLVTWRHLPTALSPGDDGPDVDGCWSGSLVRGGGDFVLFYSGMRQVGELRRQSICRAISTDPRLTSWTKDPRNPLIAEPPPGIEPDLFRDPFVWRDGDGWSMLVGAGTTDGAGTVLLYRSPDLRSWTFAGPILSSAEVDPAADSDGPVWECPQLLRGPDADVLIVSVVDRAPGVRPSHVSAFVGRLDGTRFIVERAQQLGMGPDFYAPATAVLPDGRWLLYGWIPEDPPGPASERTWAGSLTFPRVVSVMQDRALSLSLATEVASLHGPSAGREARDLSADAVWRRAIPDEPFEMQLAIEPAEAAEVVVELLAAGLASSGSLGSVPIEPAVRLAYRSADRRLSVARSGIVSFAGRSSMSTTLVPAADGPILRLRAVLDGSVFELEANGHLMATLRLPDHVAPPRTVVITASGGGAVVSLERWRLAASG